MLFKQAVSVYTESNTKPMKCKMQRIVKPDGTYSYHSALKVSVRRFPCLGTQTVPWPDLEVRMIYKRRRSSEDAPSVAAMECL
jgi:hypothetical protein